MFIFPKIPSSLGGLPLSLSVDGNFVLFLISTFYLLLKKSVPECCPVENYICSLLKSFCNSQYKFLIFRAFYGLYTTHRGHGPPWVLHDRFTPFWGKWPKNPSYRLELQPFRVEVDHPFQWPHFAGNNSQHLCNALGQGQTRRCQWGPVRPPRRLKASLPGGDGMELEGPGLSLTRACDEEPQTIATMHSAPLVFPNLLVFQELEIWIFLKMGNLFF